MTEHDVEAQVNLLTEQLDRLTSLIETLAKGQTLMLDRICKLEYLADVNAEAERKDAAIRDDLRQGA